MPFHRSMAMPHLWARFLDTQGTLRQQGVIDIGHFNRGDSTIITTHPIDAAGPATLRPGKQPPERDHTYHTLY